MSIIKTTDFNSIQELSEALKDAAQHEEMAFLLIENKLFTVVPAEIASQKIAEKIALRLAENPSIIHDLQSRLETEEPEDWE